jgi:hypothetical protein
MREHLEAINHQEAIVFIKIVLKRMSFLVKKKSFPAYYHFTILPKEAGNYRTIGNYNKDKALLVNRYSSEIEALFW